MIIELNHITSVIYMHFTCAVYDDFCTYMIMNNHIRIRAIIHDYKLMTVHIPLTSYDVPERRPFS